MIGFTNDCFIFCFFFLSDNRTGQSFLSYMSAKVQTEFCKLVKNFLLSEMNCLIVCQIQGD